MQHRSWLGGATWADVLLCKAMVRDQVFKLKTGFQEAFNEGTHHPHKPTTCVNEASCCH
jgi:hypothetical protein